MSAAPFTFYEFFAGGGMARAGLGAGWDCRFANDFDPVKAATYRANWGEGHFHQGDVHALSPADLPGHADLAWASSPCQDFSLAGLRKGLAGTRSSAFWGFWTLMRGLNAEGRAPRVIVVENVTGLLTSHGGADFTALCQALADEGYVFGALEIDAARFLPQSRPRLFVIATKGSAPLGAPSLALHGRRICDAFARLPEPLQARWAAWAQPQSNGPADRLTDLLDDGAQWHSPARTERLLSLLSPLHQTRVALEQAMHRRSVGLVYRRTRMEDGQRVQRAEVRFDGVAGCLRTPGGGSSRQFLIEVCGPDIRSRPLTAREGARLMGLSDEYRLPEGETAALKVIGDGVAVPVVSALARAVLIPALSLAALVAAE